MEIMNATPITPEWLKVNGWRYYNGTANKKINKQTYYIRLENLARCGGCTGRLSKLIAVVSAVEVVEELIATGQEFVEDKVVAFKPEHTVISRYWPEENGWGRIEDGDGEFSKCVNNVWYELEYTDFDCDYMLKKEFALVQTVEELEALLK